MKSQATRRSEMPLVKPIDHVFAVVVVFVLWAIGSSLEYESLKATAERNQAQAAQPGGTQHVQQAR